jgi:hypothetical protein
VHALNQFQDNPPGIITTGESHDEDVSQQYSQLPQHHPQKNLPDPQPLSPISYFLATQMQVDTPNQSYQLPDYPEGAEIPSKIFLDQQG